MVLLMEKYPTMLDWIRTGVINVKLHKKEYQHSIIRSMGLPHLDIDVLDGVYANTPAFQNRINMFLNKTRPVVFISSPKNENLPKDMIDLVMCWEQIKQFMSNVQNPQDYNFIITEMVVGIPDSYTGIIVSDGKGNAVIEFYVREKWVDPRTLSSGWSERKYHDLTVIKDSEIKRLSDKVPADDVNYIFSKVKETEGYFEFIKGIKNDVRGIYFMEFQNDPAFTKVLNMV
jgi:hypothetical protein